MVSEMAMTEINQWIQLPVKQRMDFDSCPYCNNYVSHMTHVQQMADLFKEVMSQRLAHDNNFLDALEEEGRGLAAAHPSASQEIMIRTLNTVSMYRDELTKQSEQLSAAYNHIMNDIHNARIYYSELEARNRD